MPGGRDIGRTAYRRAISLVVSLADHIRPHRTNQNSPARGQVSSHPARPGEARGQDPVQPPRASSQGRQRLSSMGARRSHAPGPHHLAARHLTAPGPVVRSGAVRYPPAAVPKGTHSSGSGHVEGPVVVRRASVRVRERRYLPPHAPVIGRLQAPSRALAASRCGRASCVRHRRTPPDHTQPHRTPRAPIDRGRGLASR
jgi:hypothetical protein